MRGYQDPAVQSARAAVYALMPFLALMLESQIETIIFRDES